MFQASNLGSMTSSTPQKNQPCCAQPTPHRLCGANAATWQVSRPSRHPLPAWYRSCRRCLRQFRESICAPTCRTAPCNACSCLRKLFCLRRLLRTPGLPALRAAAALRRQVRPVATVACGGAKYIVRAIFMVPCDSTLFCGTKCIVRAIFMVQILREAIAHCCRGPTRQQRHASASAG